MDNDGLKHWASTVLVAITAGFVIFGLIYGQDFLKDFFKEQETKIEVESELIEQESSIENESSQNNEGVIPFREAVILITPTPFKPLNTIFPKPSLTPESQASLIVPSPIPLVSNSPATTPEDAATPTPVPTYASSLAPTPTPVSISSPQATPVQQQTQSQCQQGQVDINTAPKEELLKIKHIGDVRADELITLRPFSSLDDMDRIKGIGPARVQDIKNEGIACVQ